MFATIPAGVVGKHPQLCLNIELNNDFQEHFKRSKSLIAAALKVYKKSLANVDYLHGSAESMLTVTNLLIGESLMTV